MKQKIVLVLGVLVLGVGAYFTGTYENLIASLITSSNNMKNEQIVLHTNQGDITIKLYSEKIPKATENFRTLAKEGKYDNTIFHRVIKGFMIQGGDFENHNGTGGQSIWGKEFNDEFSEGLSHVRGAVSMANRGPNTNGSQFFIVQQDATYLDGGYTIFGHVTAGMDVVDKIANTQTDYMDKPLEDIKIESVDVINKK